MAVLEQSVAEASKPKSLAKLCTRLWKGKVSASVDEGGQVCRLSCGVDQLVDVCQWLMGDLGFALATLVVEEKPDVSWSLLYIFYQDATPSWAYVELELEPGTKRCHPSAVSSEDLQPTGMSAKPKIYSA